MEIYGRFPGGFGELPGTGLKSPAGPSGQVSEELARAFEAALNNDGEAQQNLNVSEPAPGAEAAVDPPGTRAEAPGLLPEQISRANDGRTALRVETTANQPPVAEPEQKESIPRTGDERELARLIGRIEEGAPSVEELFRLQYLTGMLKAHAVAGQGASRKMGESLESVLKHG